MLLSYPTIQLSTVPHHRNVQQLTTMPTQPHTPNAVLQQCNKGLHQNIKPVLPYPTYRLALPYLPNMLTPSRFLDYRLVCSSNSAVDILQLLAGRPTGRGSCVVLAILFIISEASTSALGTTQ